jgi:CBS domain-containing protein
MENDSYLFWKVSEVGRRQVVTCAPGDCILAAAALMRERKVSGLVVCVGDEPVGMITDRDFRNRLDEIARTAGELPVSHFMSAPVRTIGEGAYLFEAIYRMARHRIHRLVVTGADGKLSGIITDADLIKIQLTTPLYLGRDIDRAQTIEDLAAMHKRVVDVVSHASRSGAKTDDLVRLISHFHDTISQKAVEILLRESEEPVTDRFAFLALGSEGRGEQTLKTDQDNAIVFADDLPPAGLASLEAFSERLIAALIRVGVPPCPGGIMANKREWRRSVTEWCNAVEQWITAPTPEHLLSFGMFSDLRTIHGPPEFEKQIKDVVLATVKQYALFLASLAKNVLRSPPPLGLLGRLKLENSGENKGKVDIKKKGILPITEGITVLGLDAGILFGGTREKIEALKTNCPLPLRELEQIEQAFTFLSHLRLQHQLSRIKGGLTPDNHIDPRQLSPAELGRLKESFLAVRLLQHFLRQQYKLDLLGQ